MKQKKGESASTLEAATAPSDISAEPASFVDDTPAPVAEETPSDTDSLQKMLRVLGLADKYLEILQSEMMDFNTLKNYLDNWGIDKLLHELKEVGVDKEGARMKIAKYLRDKNIQVW